jgi:hypothetical protein
LKQKANLLWLLCALASFFACGSSNNPSTTPTTILPHRAFISNLTSSRIDVADTTRDLIVTTISAELPGLMRLSSDKKYTVVVSPADNSVEFLKNSTQGSLATANFAGASQSVVSTVDNSLILGAVPTESGPVGQAPGAVDVITVALSSVGTTISATLTRQPSIFLPGARFLGASPDTNRILAMSDQVPNPANPGGPTGRVWLIKSSLVNTNTQPYEEIVSTVWDHPVFAIGSTDNTTAYILNCGKECGGTQASLVKLDLTVDPPVPSAPLLLPSGGTVGFLNGNTLYIAGSDPRVVCPSSISTPPCGALTPVDLGAFTSGTPLVIAGGYHDRMTLGSNNLLFVGSHGCNFNAGAGLGCLSSFDTVKLKATVLPPAVFTPPATDPGNDDVTGMTPIANRNEVYVIEAGELVIYDTTTGLPKVLSNPPNVVGQGVDVIALDF